ncbi:MAG: DciA family protein [Acidobacteriota bacterium]
MTRDRFERARGSAQMRELVQRVVDHHHLDLDIREERLFAEWPAFVGDKVGARTRPDAILDRTLIVEVATSSWLHELRLLRPKIVSDLLDKLGMPRLFDDIRFVLAGERRRRAPTVRPAARRPPPPPRGPFPPATGAALREILEAAAKVEDPELRELIARVRVANDK